MNIFNGSSKKEDRVSVSPTDSKKKPLSKKLIYTLIGSVVLLILISIGTSGSSAPSTPAPQIDSVSVGETGYLESSASNVLVATTKDNLDEIVKLSVANDTEGLAQMTLDGDAYIVDQGTQVRVIDTTIGTREVRILEGKQYGKSGWVPVEFVKKTK